MIVPIPIYSAMLGLLLATGLTFSTVRATAIRLCSATSVLGDLYMTIHGSDAMRRVVCALIGSCLSAAVLAQAPQFSNAVRGFIKVDAPVVALTNVRVIDGTGAPPRENQTIVISDGNIAAIGDGAQREATGRAPPCIDLDRQERHPRPRDGARAPLLPDRPRRLRTARRELLRLYLAGGVTTMRTGGNVNGFMDLKLKRLIDAGQKAGPGHRRDRAVPERPEHVLCRCAT